MNRFLKLILVLIPFLIAGAAIYYFTRSEPAEPAEEPAVASPPVALVSEEVRSPSLSFSGQTLWYFIPAGRLFSLPTTGGSPEEFFLPEVPGFVSALWDTGEESNFIVEQNLDGHAAYQFFDAEFRNLLPYPDGLWQPRFAAFPEGEADIVYVWRTAEGKLELKVADLTSENFRTVTELFRADYRIEPSPAESQIALYTENQASPSRLFIVDLTSGAFTDLSNPFAYQGVKFSPDGKKLLALRFEESGGQPNLYVHDLVSQGVLALGTSAAIDQVAWSADSKKILVVEADKVAEIDVETGERAEPHDFSGTGLEPTNLLPHPIQSLLFFIDQKTGHLYRLDLPAKNL